MKKLTHYITILSAILFCSTAVSQTDTEFWFVKPNITQEHTNESFKIVVTARDFDADVTIEMPAEPGFTPVNFTVPAFTTYVHNITQPSAEFSFMENNTVVAELSEIPANQDNIGNKAILLTSTAPVNAYFTQIANNNSDIYALKGGNGIGTEFIIPFQEHAYNQDPAYNERAFSSIEIISYEDGTVIEITPPAGRNVYRNGANPNYGASYTVTLDRGQVYTCPPAWDPTVTRNNTANSGWWGVEGNQRLGGIIVKVLTGEGVAVIKKDDSARKYTAGGWDIIADQWVPYKGAVGADNDILGTEYLAMRGNLDNGWEYVYVAAPEDNTRIWWGNSIDTSSAPVGVVLDRGEQHGILFNKGVYTVGPKPFNFMEIKSNKPLSVLHVSGNGREMGGAVLPPIDRCTGSTSVSFTRDINWPFYINIMARAGHETEFLVDGVQRNDIIDPTSFVPVGTSGEWVATQLYYAAGDLVDFPVGTVRTISNTSDVFHLGLINGNSTGGCRFGYFSDFNELRVSANTIQGDGSQPSSTIRACKGDTVQLYASGGSVFNWWPSTNLSSTTIANPTTVVDAFRTYYVEVSGACDNKDTATVTIEMAEQPDAVFFMEKGEGCAPLELQMRNLSTDVNQIYWDFNTTNIGGVVDRDTTKYHPSVIRDVDSVFTHTFFNTSFEPVDSPETYHIQLKVKATKCVDTINTTLTVYPEVTAAFNLSDLDDTLSCNPVEVDFEAVAPSVNEDYYKWNFGDGALSASGDTTHEYVNFDPVNDTTYTARLVVRSQWFCRDTAYQDFTVHPYLEGGFTIDKDEGCSPFNVTIENVSSGADSIFLDYGDGQIDTLLSFNAVTHLYQNNDGVDEVDTNIIVMRVKNNEGCEFIDRDTIVVYPEFEATYTIDGNDYTGCNSRTVTFTNTTNDGTHLASRYLWEFDDGTSMDTTNNTINKLYNNTTSGDKTYNFRLTARSIYGCEDDITNSIDIYRAYANFTVDNNEGCSPLDVAVTNISIGDQITTWDWNYGDGHTDNVKNPFPYTYTNNTAANITNQLRLQVTGTNGCSTSKTIDITVYPQIQATYTISATSLASCDSLVVDFDSDIDHPGLEPTTIYTWDFGDGASSSIADPTHVYKNLSSATLITRRVDLHVETPLGCVYDISSFIDVYPMVNAKFAVDKVAGCSPLSVNAVATEYIGVDEYNWTYGDGYNPNVSDPPVHTYPVNPPGANDIYTLRLDVQDLTGTCTDFATRTITVYDEVLADFNPKNSTDCNPYTITFDNQSQNAVSYKWDFDDGGTTSTQFEPTYTFVNALSSTNIFEVELEATSDEGCTDVTTSNVNVLPYVVADFDIDVSEGCSPLTVTIDNNSAGGNYRWYWNSSDGSGVADYTSTNSNEIFNHTYTNQSGSDNTVYLTLIAENASGCTDTTTIPITVYSETKADFNPQGSIDCNPYSVAFDNLSFNASTYQWNFNDGTTSNAFEPTHVFTNLTSSNNPFNVKLEVTSNRGCKHDTTATVSVYPYVNANFDISVSEGCSPLTVEISNNSAGGNYRWFWNSSDGSGVADYTSANSTEVFNHTYTNSSGVSEINNLMVISDNGNGCYDTLIRPITVHSTIDAEFDVNIDEGCNPLAVQFTNNTVNGSDYTWDFGDGSSTTTASPNKVFTNTTTTDKPFTVRLTAESAEGCVDTEDTVITVYSKVISDFSIATSEGCPPFTTTIDNTSIGNVVNTYQWLIDNVAVGGAPTDKSDFDHTYENTVSTVRDYEVKLIATNPHGCTSEQTDIVSVYEYVEASFSMDVNDGCTPLLVEFTDLSMVPADTKYTWDFGDGASSGLSDPDHTFYNSSRTSDLQRTIDLTVQSANYCSDDTSLTVDIYHQPLAKFYIDKTSSCPPLQSTITKLSQGEDMFEWRFGDGNTSTTDENFTYSWDNTDIDNIQYYNLELWVGTNNNCVDSTSLDVTVFPKVTADFTISDTAGCSPLEDVQFLNASTSPATQFFWTFGDGSYTNIEDPVHDFTNITSVDRVYDIYLRASSEYNCSDDTTKQITVYRQPDAEFYIDPNYMTFPENIVGISNETNTGPFDYYWEFGDINNSTSTAEDPNQFEYEHWGVKIIDLLVTSQTNSDCFDTFSDTVIILPPKVNADFTTDINGGCVDGGLEVQFTAAGSAYNEEYQYDWEFGDGTTGEGQYITHTYTEAGSYYVKLTARSNEYTELEEDYAYKTIYAYANPEVNFEVSPREAMLDPTTLEARIKFYNTTSCNDTAGCIYTWEFGDGETANSRDVTHAYAPSPSDFVELDDGTRGIYYDIKLTATTEHGCEDDTTFNRHVKIIGAGQIAFPNAFTPDGYGPAENETFKPLAEGVIEYELFIYNRWGELIFTTKDLSVGWDGTINGEMAKPDVYVWKAQGKFTNGKSFELAGDVTLIR